MAYVVGFVTPVPKKNLAKYKALAAKTGRLWMKHGALSCVECIEDDVKPGKVTSFPQSVKLKKGEVVAFSYITYKSARHRASVDKKVMAEPLMSNYDPKSMPFDGQRMFWGGFKTIVSM